MHAILGLLKLGATRNQPPVFVPGFIRIERESRRTHLALLAAVFAILALGNVAILVVKFPAWYAQTRFERDCVTTTATITKVDGHTPDYFQTLGVTFAYTANGAAYTASVPWVIQTHKVGGTLRVRYLPYKPATVQVRGKEPLTTSPFPLLSFGTLFGLLTRGALIRRTHYREEIQVNFRDFSESVPDIPVTARPDIPQIYVPVISVDDLPLNPLPTDR